MPPDHGNSLDNAGIPLAKLLFFMKDASALLTLIEALLFERYAAAPRLAGTMSAAMHLLPHCETQAYDSCRLQSADCSNVPRKRCF